MLRVIDGLAWFSTVPSKRGSAAAASPPLYKMARIYPRSVYLHLYNGKSNHLHVRMELEMMKGGSGGERGLGECGGITVY